MIHTKNKIKKTASKRTGENGQAKKNSGERGHVVIQLSCWIEITSCNAIFIRTGIILRSFSVLVKPMFFLSFIYIQLAAIQKGQGILMTQIKHNK